MHLEEDTSPCGIFRFESKSPIVQVHMGCGSKRRFTVLCYVALPLSVKNLSLALGHRNPGLNRGRGFHPVWWFSCCCTFDKILHFVSEAFFPMTGYGFSNKCASLRGFQ